MSERKLMRQNEMKNIKTMKTCIQICIYLYKYIYIVLLLLLLEGSLTGHVFVMYNCFYICMYNTRIKGLQRR